MSEKTQRIIMVAGGVATGFLNGYLGSGAGVVAVLLLSFLPKLTTRQTHATALFIVLPLSVVSAAVYLFDGKIPFLPALFATVGVTVGGIIGAKLLNKLKTVWIELIFACLLLLGGIRMFFA